MAVKTRKPRQRSKRARQVANGTLAICGQVKKNGEPCMMDAGAGTDHPGKGACHVHEDRDRRGLMTAARGLGVPQPTSPTKAIMGILELASGELVYVTEKVAALTEEEVWTGETKERLNKWLRWQEKLMDRVARYAATAAGMGVAERDIALREAQTKIIGRLLEAIIGDLDLTPKQRKAVGPAIRNHLALIQGEATEKAGGG